MSKLYFDSRDELIALDAEQIAAVVAAGNYSRVLMLRGREVMLTQTLGRVGEHLQRLRAPSARFVRLGRSLVVNHTLLARIDLLRQMLILSDGANEIRLKAPKEKLQTYKKAIARTIQIKQSHAADSDHRD